MTIDDFFAHVQENGFNGYSPGKGDVLGDRWSAVISDLFERTANAVNLERGEFRHLVWLVWQWLYCEVAGMRSRVIASPPAIRAAGLPLTDNVVSRACELLLESESH